MSSPDFSGVDKLQFTVTDSVGTSAPATVTIQVTGSGPGARQVVADIGVSTDWVCYWCAAQPFVDVLHQAAGFADPATGAALRQLGKLDADGWPLADFKVFVLDGSTVADDSRNDPGTLSTLTGNYQLSFNGKASLRNLGYGSVADQVYDVASNTTTATVIATLSAGNGFNLTLQFTDTQRTAASATDTGVTNIRLIRPQFAPNGQKWWTSPSQQFTTPFLDSFKGFSTIRYMNWTKPINSPEVDWADRTPANWPGAGRSIQAAASSLPYLVPKANCTAHCDWYSTGESWESAIDLANATHTDMWINIPTLATDDYAKSLAALLKSRLDPALKVYVEWTDEVWNYANPWWTETNYNADQTTALLASDPAAKTRYQAHCASWAYNVCHVAERVKAFADDFAAVYGQAAINTTIRPVPCTQLAQPVMLSEALGYIASAYGPPSNYFYGVCGAPYWNPKTAMPAGSTAADVMAAMEAAVGMNVPSLQAYTMLALYYGLRHFTYEGGPSLDYVSITGASAAERNAILKQVNLAPGMQAQVVRGLTGAFQSGVDMFMYYIGVQNSVWGATPDVLDLDAPKFAGLKQLAGKNVTRQAGIALPGSIPTNPAPFGVRSDGTLRQMGEGWYYSSANGTSPAHGNFNGTGPDGSGLAYLASVAHAGTYDATLVLNVAQKSFASKIELDVDGKSVGTFAVPEKPAGQALTVGPLQVALGSGLHVIAIKSAGTTRGFSIDSIDFAAQ